MFVLKLKKGMSYSGVVNASKKNPFVTTEDEAVAKAAVSSGYFDLVKGDFSQMAKIAAPAGTAAETGEGDGTGTELPDGIVGSMEDDKEPEEAGEPELEGQIQLPDMPDFDALDAMSREDLKAFAIAKEIDLTGVKYAKADILEAISKHYDGSDTMMALQQE